MLRCLLALEKRVGAQLRNRHIERRGDLGQDGDAVDRAHSALHLRKPALGPTEKSGQLDLRQSPAAAIVRDAFTEGRRIVHLYCLCASTAGMPLPSCRLRNSTLGSPDRYWAFFSWKRRTCSWRSCVSKASLSR